MRPFAYARPSDEERAVAAATGAERQYIAGGTTLVDLMRLDVMRPAGLVDLNALPLRNVELIGDVVRIGTLVRNSDLAHHPTIKQRYPMLSQALLSGASPQLRNMATLGGNALQRTRCTYFRDLASSCNKRAPGSGCSALDGYNRMHAILGGSDACIAVHPSDMCVALVALDATVRTRGRDGVRTIPFRDLHTVPGDHPEVESVLQPGELVTHIDLAPLPWATRSTYVKVRDRASYAFALASAAVALDLQRGNIVAARVALGGVGTKPWRSVEAETVLSGQLPTVETFRRAAVAALAGAKGRAHNGYKIELAQRTLIRALQIVAGES